MGNYIYTPYSARRYEWEELFYTNKYWYCYYYYLDFPVFLAVVDVNGNREYIDLLKRALLASLEGNQLILLIMQILCTSNYELFHLLSIQYWNPDYFSFHIPALPRKAYFGLVTYGQKIGIYDLNCDYPHIRYISIQDHTGQPSLDIQELFSHSKFFAQVNELIKIEAIYPSIHLSIYLSIYLSICLIYLLYVSTCCIPISLLMFRSCLLPYLRLCLFCCTYRLNRGKIKYILQ